MRVGEIAARSALECGSSSYRLPTSPHTIIAPSPHAKAVAAATALQGAAHGGETNTPGRLCYIHMEDIFITKPGTPNDL